MATDELDEILENYRAWLLGKNEREKTWLIKSEAKARLEQLIADKERASRVDELQALDSNPQMFGDWQQIVLDRIAILNNKQEGEKYD